jgi:Tol biopolymer transport system component
VKAALLVAAALLVLTASGAAARDAFAPEPSYADFGPALSPDGTKLAFLREGITRSRLVRYQSLYVARSNGRSPIALTKGALQSSGNIDVGRFDGVVSASWSPDGSRLVYAHNYAASGNDHVHSELVIVDADGTHPRQLTRTDESSGFMRATWPSWSPAGDKIVFAAAGKIEVVNTDGSGLTELTPGAYDSDPAWSPDGSKIAFITGGDDHVSVMNADGSDLRMVSPLPSRNPAWSPDGRTIVFSAKEGEHADIYSVGADGTGQRRLTSNPAEDITPIFARDGKSVIFGSSRGRGVDSGDLWVMNADGSGQHPLAPRPRTRSSNGRACTIMGTVAVDTLLGSSAADVACGLAGNDQSLGLKGNDVLEGGPGEDFLDGGTGNDVILARDGRRDTIRGGPGIDRARVDRGVDRVSGVEKFIP